MFDSTLCALVTLMECQFSTCKMWQHLQEQWLNDVNAFIMKAVWSVRGYCLSSFEGLPNA